MILAFRCLLLISHLALHGIITSKIPDRKSAKSYTSSWGVQIRDSANADDAKSIADSLGLKYTKVWNSFINICWRIKLVSFQLHAMEHRLVLVCLWLSVNYWLEQFIHRQLQTIIFADVAIYEKETLTNWRWFCIKIELFNNLIFGVWI